MVEAEIVSILKITQLKDRHPNTGTIAYSVYFYVSIMAYRLCQHTNLSQSAGTPAAVRTPHSVGVQRDEANLVSTRTKTVLLSLILIENTFSNLARFRPISR